MLKAARIEMTSTFLKELILGKLEPFKTNLPNDLQIFDVQYDSLRQVYIFVAASDSFNVVPEGAYLPKFDVLSTTIKKD